MRVVISATTLNYDTQLSEGTISVRANVNSNAILNTNRQQPMARKGRFAIHLQALNNYGARCAVVQNSQADLGSICKATDNSMGNSEPVQNTFRFAPITQKNPYWLQM
jgi:hypothetical protein